MLIILLIALVAVGFMLGEPLLGLFEPKTPPVVSGTPDNEVTQTSEPDVTTTPTTTEEEVTTTVPPEPQAPENGMLRLSFVGSADLRKSLDAAISYAMDNNYQSILVELVADGGTIYFATSNKLASR